MSKKALITLISMISFIIALSTCFAFAASAAGTSVNVNNATAYRGETVTFNATLSESVEVGSGSLALSYNSNVLELVGGTCNVSGAMLSNFDVAKGKGAFAFSGTGTVSGNLFTVTFKVKDTAAFGTSNVSLNVTLKDGSNAVISLTNNAGSITVECNHSFTKEDTAYLKSAATCTSPAIYYKSCVTCGEKGTETFEYGAPAAHSYTKQVTTDTYKKSDATCTAKAVYYYCCATCDAKGTTTYESGTTLSHSYTRQVTTDTYKVSDADCDSKAVYYYCCATCDKAGTATFAYGDALGHTGGTATCTTKAECTRCHQPYGNTLEHVYTDEDATATYLKAEATCTSKAVYYKNCATCDKAGTATFEYGSTIAHSYTRQVTTDTYKKSDATCTAKAVYYYCCATCDAKGTTTYESGTVLGHSYTRQVTTDTYKVSDADCDSKAVYYYCCATCDKAGTATFAYGDALGHTGGTATCTTKAECTRCHQPYGNTLEHVYTDEDATATYLKAEATCTSKAVYYKNCATCDKAGTATFEYGSTIAHSYTRQVTTDTYKKSDATCTAKAVYYYCCATCDAKGTTTYESGTVLGHSYTRQVITDAYKKSDATCTAKAVYYYCCATCDKAGTATFAYGDALGHTGGTATCTTKAECTRCHQPYGNTLEHVYTDEDATATYLKAEATCTSKAVYYKNCATCDKAGTATFEHGTVKAHSYIEKVEAAYLKSPESCTSKAVYYKSCSACGAKGTDTFEVGDAPSHNYQSTWSSDETSHWHECSKCQDKKDLTSHIAGPAATETTGQKCTVCDYIITPALGHSHNYSSEWTNNSTEHWHACTGCSSTKDKAEHNYTNACDVDCNTCGFTREITHAYKSEWTNNAAKHWYECSICGSKTGEVDHIPGPEATETTDQVCTVCGYVIKEALGHTHTYDNKWMTDASNHWHECSCGEKFDEATHSGGAATCQEKAKCSICNAEYGTLSEHSDYDKNGKCDVCNYLITPNNGGVEIENAESGASIKIPEGGGATIPEGTIFVVVQLPATDITEEALEQITDYVEGNTNILAYCDLSLLLDGTPIHPNEKMLVTFPAVEGNYDRIIVLYIADDGSFEECVTTLNKDGTITFETDHFSKYAIIGVNDIDTKAELHIGVIVGIVIGAVIIIGIGTFLIVWKKKSFKNH